MNKVRKMWRVVNFKTASWMELILYQEGQVYHELTFNITGASPAYVEELVERLNIHINNMLYELGRIPR